MDTPFKMIVIFGIVLIGFTTFSALFNSQDDIDNIGYVTPSNSSYDTLGILTDMSLFDFIASIMDMETGLPVIDNMFKALFAICIAILIAWYIRGM